MYVTPPPKPLVNPADFSTWDRKTLEQFARQAADENRELREDIKVVIDAWREEVHRASE
jgi:hypothetical protein